jgi:hypothetical protein
MLLGFGLDAKRFLGQILDISSFLVLLGLGIALRKNAAAHKRMMILSSAAQFFPVLLATVERPHQAVGNHVGKVAGTRRT